MMGKINVKSLDKLFDELNYYKVVISVGTLAKLVDLDVKKKIAEAIELIHQYMPIFIFWIKDKEEFNHQMDVLQKISRYYPLACFSEFYLRTDDKPEIAVFVNGKSVQDDWSLFIYMGHLIMNSINVDAGKEKGAVR